MTTWRIVCPHCHVAIEIDLEVHSAHDEFTKSVYDILRRLDQTHIEWLFEPLKHLFKNKIMTPPILEYDLDFKRTENYTEHVGRADLGIVLMNHERTEYMIIAIELKTLVTNLNETIGQLKKYTKNPHAIAVLLTGYPSNSLQPRTEYIKTIKEQGYIVLTYDMLRSADFHQRVNTPSTPEYTMYSATHCLDEGRRKWAHKPLEEWRNEQWTP